MDLPDKNSPVWKNLLDGTIDIKFEYMAINLLLFNQKCIIQKDPNSMDTAIDNVHEFFKGMLDVPKVQQALEKIKQASK